MQPTAQPIEGKTGMTRTAPAVTTIRELQSKYEALLFDAYGVLVDGSGPLPGAVEMIDGLNRSGTKYFIVTNVSSRPDNAIAEKFISQGLNIEPHRIISSGSLLGEYVRNCRIANPNCFVVGSPLSQENLTNAGARILAEDSEVIADLFVISDLSRLPGTELMDRLEAFMNKVVEAARAGKNPTLLIGNPDPSFPVDSLRFGFTPGSVATMIESALEFELPSANIKFIRLGKPYSPIFQQAAILSATKNMVMIGDHMSTDIKGAVDFGIASALVSFNPSNAEQQLRSSTFSPTYLLPSLS